MLLKKYFFFFSYRMVLEFLPEILNIYSAKNTTSIKLYDPVLLTTSEVLTESQIFFVSTLIENLRDKSERGQNEAIMYEKILPEFIIFIFGKKFNFNKKDALKRLQDQEDYRSLFAHNESLF